MERGKKRRRPFSCIGYSMAPKVAGLQGPGFLPVGIHERMIVQELPNTTRRSIRDGIATINQYILRLVFDNSVNPLRQILANGAGHLQGVVCQKQ